VLRYAQQQFLTRYVVFMSVQLPLSLARPHQNAQLFSDYYLDQVLPQEQAWQLLAGDAAPVMAEVARIVAAYTPSENEAQTEEGLIRPVLRALGHAFEVQPALHTPLGTKRPDYVLYRDAQALGANKGATLDDARLRTGALAVGDAKYYDRPLDAALKKASGNDINAHPGIQIDFYIRHSGLAWGLLTNGRLWRLYHKDSSAKLDRFYQVDLAGLLQSQNVEAFLYFYAFFRRQAFDDHELGLERLLQASTNYARGVGDTLKQQVYDALRHLAQGFLDHPANRLATDPATLQQIYDNSLIVLYRLLFILYAEARELLPLRESELYRRQYSLQAIARDVAQQLDANTFLLPASTTIWQRLRELFAIIDQGSPPLQVATFNGGLFDSQRHPFLEQYRIGDAHLQRALDKLVRAKGQLIDYRDLAERHLGSIYEGLLEYHLQALAVPEGHWTVALLNDKGQRHSTGSYYTPDWVVRYMVEATLGPVLRAAVADTNSDADKVAAILAVNCLDPSMGSGHFPVAAMEYIARFIVEEVPSPTGDAQGETDLQYWKRRVAQSCIYGVDLNPLAVELAKLSLWLATAAKGKPLSFLDHHLRCGNALVGARLAELRLGGERRKTTHKQQAQQQAAGQLSMLQDSDFARSMGVAVGSMWLIEESAGSTVAEVKEQERLYAGLRDELTRRYARLADLATATHFGVAVDGALWQPLSDYATGRSLAAPARFSEWLAQSEALARQHRFFHWELEFPEVFFNQHGQPLGEGAGFDAVIGNPPYVRQEQLAPLKPYLADAYKDVYAGTADLFVYFFAQALRLLHTDGRTAYISSNSWLRAAYAAPLRALLRQAATVEQVIDLGDNRVFADAPDVYPAIHVVRRAAPPPEHAAQVAVFNRGEGVKNFAAQVAAKLQPVSIHDQADSGWQLAADDGRRLFAKLVAAGRPLGDVVDGKIYRGILTGLNEAFIIDQTTRDQLIQNDTASATIIKPVLRGEDLRPWYQEGEDRFIIFARRGIDIDAYPAVKAHLKQFRDQLEPRPIEWDIATPWKGRKPGSYKWYEIQDSVDYYKAFDQPKIFWPELAKQPRFSWDDTGAYINNKGFVAPTNETWLLGLLNSRAIWFVIMRTCLGLGERAGMERFQLFAQYISKLPIPDAPTPEREAIGALALQITEQARARYTLHTRARRRIQQDVGIAGKGLNQRLTAWWDLDFPAFRAELHKVWKRDIALKERDDWDEWLNDQRARHAQLTDAIVARERALNQRVYALFGLSPTEVTLIEASTKYRYGEV
jgi:type I restriction-modification system DNA methylase subunit